VGIFVLAYSASEWLGTRLVLVSVATSRVASARGRITRRLPVGDGPHGIAAIQLR
jgi:hypothetical protein